jgi:hypothetical protein
MNPWRLTDVNSDGNIRYFEYENDKFEFLTEYKSGEPQRGIAFLPRRGVNVSLQSQPLCWAVITPYNIYYILTAWLNG